jgi:predicted nucleic acid-binding protein
MGYVIDTSVLIDAKDDYYAFDLCPGFWEWLQLEAAAGEVVTIEMVRHELMGHVDELSAWAKRQNRDSFKAEDAACAEALKRVSEWVQAASFKDSAKREFLADTDPHVIAYALAHGHTVVSHEIHNAGNANQRKKVKVPTVCLGLDVKCEFMFPWLLARGARFVLEAGKKPPAPPQVGPIQPSLFQAEG